MNLRKVGIEYLNALAAAQAAQHRLETNDGDNYDPCGETKKRVEAEFDAAIEHLMVTTKL